MELLNLCRHWKITPGQLRNEDVGELVRLMAVESYVHAYQSVMAPGSKADVSGMPYAQEFEANLKAQLRGEL